jgi:uncharacterized protein
LSVLRDSSRGADDEYVGILDDAIAVQPVFSALSGTEQNDDRGRIHMPDSDKPLEKVLEGLLHKELYIAVTGPLGGPGLAEKLHEHILGQIELERSHILFGAGPLQDEGTDRPTRGMFIIRASSFAEARSILDGDVFHKAGLRTYKLYRWSLNEGSITLTINYSDQTAKIT